MLKGRTFACVAAIAAFSIAQYDSAQAAGVPRGSGAKMCVLTQADFKPFGTLVWSKPQIHVDAGSDNNVYCTYRGESGATGGVELDVFYPAGSSPDDIKNTLKTVLDSDPGAKYLSEGVPGADESLYSLNVPSSGHFPFAANAVRRGDLVFAISLPSSPVSKIEMLKLSQIVLSRLSK
jgi:hypothetical protein